VPHGQINPVRRYTYAGQRRIHYREAGNGQAVLLLHDWMSTSKSMEPWMYSHASGFFMVALDLPGCGESEALLSDADDLFSYVNALEETLGALGLGRVSIYGEGTGAALAVAYAFSHPERIAQLAFRDLMDRNHPEREALWLRAADPQRPQVDGTHVVRSWSMLRDSKMSDPWFFRDAQHRLEQPMPNAEALHDATLELLRGYGQSNALLRAALNYGALGHLTELQSVVKYIVEQAGAAEAVSRSFCPALTPHNTKAIYRSYVSSSVGTLLVRIAGAANNLPVLLIHSSPQSGAAVEPLMHVFAESRRVIAFDTPGNGDSSSCPGTPSIGGLAKVLAEGLDTLGVNEFDVYGTHTGAAIAIELALLKPAQVRRVILDGVSTFTRQEVEEYMERYAPEMKIREDGSHLIQMWNFMHDMTYWFPWFKKTPSHALKVRSLDPSRLHHAFVEFLKGARSYHLPYRASISHPTKERLALLRQPVLLGHLDAAAAALPSAVVRRTAGGINPETVDVYRKFYDGQLSA
jgi:pimeloyl-ACP methyl ester carboxylesterase